MQEQGTTPTRSEKEIKIGRYSVIRKIGEGGMGVVFKVADDKGGSFAMKLLRRRSSPGITLRFQREIEILEKLDSPNIPKIYDMGEYKGKPYFIMEYIKGLSLLDYLVHKKKLRERESVQIMLKIARVIEKAHELDVIHRDIKPENIILSGKKPYIMDFGIALHDKDNLRLTKTGTFIGTPNYAPPEQAFGKKKQIGEWTDVYAMGATLYHLLTGRLPFQADSHVKVIMNIAHQKLSPVRKHNPQASEKIELVVKKATEKIIKKRYKSAGEFAEDLDAILHKKPISVSSPSVVKILLLDWRTLTVIAVLALIIALCYPEKTQKKKRRYRPRTSKSRQSEPKTPTKKKPAEKKQENTLVTFTEPVKIVPVKFKPMKSAGFRVQKNGIIEFTCDVNFGLLCIEDCTKWQNYRFTSEVKVERGELGIFMRGCDISAQFPGFLEQLEIKDCKNRWLKVIAMARGNQLSVSVKGQAGILREMNRPGRNPGEIGYGLRPLGKEQAKVYIRNILIERLK